MPNCFAIRFNLVGIPDWEYTVSLPFLPRKGEVVEIARDKLPTEFTLGLALEKSHHFTVCQVYHHLLCENPGQFDHTVHLYQR
jgi:hypothetical protein